MKILSEVSMRGILEQWSSGITLFDRHTSKEYKKKAGIEAFTDLFNIFANKHRLISDKSFSLILKFFEDAGVASKTKSSIVKRKSLLSDKL